MKSYPLAHIVHTVGYGGNGKGFPFIPHLYFHLVADIRADLSRRQICKSHLVNVLRRSSVKINVHIRCDFALALKCNRIGEPVAHAQGAPKHDFLKNFSLYAVFCKHFPDL